ncbi:hypothetical protein FPOA_06743 [Fusarium poae]|uniref:Uncharacterized protein n=1 Tax=Fusarium poae TaxID=36050 RepID=A0A1B8AIP3_FUSPO|nr:hypothetical protein FPOA_06743 [Fusarium poae]
MTVVGSVRSCTNDLVEFYSSFMDAANDQFANKTTSTSRSPFKQIKHILRPHSQLTLVSLREQSYALGWGRAELPAVLGAFSYNKHLLPTILQIGEGGPNRLIIYHGGSIQGFTSVVFLLPETKTAIITLQNSTRLRYACDWIPKMMIYQLSGPGLKHIDFKELATNAARTGTELADRVNDELEKGREKDTKPLEFKAYTGRY